ncbi:MAG: aldehyde dehydrogenase family protein, partial [bacterium]
RRSSGRTPTPPPVSERAEWLERLGDRLKEDRQELAAWVLLENGKNWREADADVMEAIDFCYYYAQQARQLGQGQQWRWPGEDNRYRREPRGPTAVILPWNFPLAILTGMTTAALVTGNPVVLKPSSNTPITAYQFVKRAQEAGIPDGVLQLVPGSGSRVGNTLVQDPRINLVAFTGSRQVGLSIHEKAASLKQNETVIKNTVLEMGGKNALIVDRDANLDEAIDGIIKSAFGYQGQKCSACSRVLLPEEKADAIVARLTEAVSSLRIGPAVNPGNFMGPVIDEDALTSIQEYRELAYREGTVVLDVDPPDDIPEGYYVGPMIVDRVQPESRLAQEEIFGPVLPIIRYGSLSEALRIANNVDYALTGGFYSRHPERIERVKKEFRVGNLYINEKITGAVVGRQPFGGFKLSGKGTKAGGPDYLKNFTWPRSTAENTVRRGFSPEEHL